MTLLIDNLGETEGFLSDKPEGFQSIRRQYLGEDQGKFSVPRQISIASGGSSRISTINIDEIGLRLSPKKRRNDSILLKKLETFEENRNATTHLRDG